MKTAKHSSNQSCIFKIDGSIKANLPVGSISRKGSNGKSYPQAEVHS